MKSNQKHIKLWLFKVALFLSVFSFSGFSLQAHTALQNVVHTELLESRGLNKQWSLAHFDKYNPSIPNLRSPGDSKSGIYALINFDTLVKTKLRLSLNTTFNYSNSSVNHQVKIPFSPTEEEIPLYSFR